MSHKKDLKTSKVVWYQPPFQIKTIVYIFFLLSSFSFSSKNTLWRKKGEKKIKRRATNRAQRRFKQKKNKKQRYDEELKHAVHKNQRTNTSPAKGKPYKSMINNKLTTHSGVLRFNNNSQNEA